jgi:NodT family efflux transporter outer membrane factor (OMF) lipoprotein
MADQDNRHCHSGAEHSLSAVILCISLILTALPLVLGGCFAPEKRAELPFDLPQEFSDLGEIEPQQKWWLDFNDPNLNELIAEALGNNFNLLAARDRIAEVRAIARKAGASLVPSIDGTGSASTLRNYQTDQSTDNFSLGLAASYEIDLWGRLRNTQDAALIELQASQEDYQTAAISLAAEVAITWFGLIETQLQMKLSLQQQQTNNKVLEVVTTQFRYGKVGIADVLQQRQLVESSNGDLAALTSAQRLLEHQLTILLAIPVNSALPRLTTLPEMTALPESGVPIDLLFIRPDVKSSYFRLQAADYRSAAAVADKYPILSISADVSTSGDRTEDLFNNWFTNLGANLFGPIIDGGSRAADVQRTEAVSRQRYYDYGQTILEAVAEVEDALVRETQQRLVLQSLEIQLKLAAETIVHVGNRYRQGVEDYQRVLIALLSHQGLQRDILTNRLQLINSRIRLYRALSGPLPVPSSKQQIAEEKTKADPQIKTIINKRGSN